MGRLSASEPLGKALDEPLARTTARGAPAAGLGLAAPDGGIWSPAAVLALQRRAGNAAVGRLLARPGPTPAAARGRPPARRVLARDSPAGPTAPVTPFSGPSLEELRPRPPATLTEAALGKEIADKLEDMVAAAGLASSTAVGSDMRFSLLRESKLKLAGPLTLTSKYELSPDQLRLQWGQAVEGHRIDSWSGLRFGTDDWSVEALVRTTYASGRLAPVENQSVGALRLTLGGHFVGEYRNDHRFIWFPMGGGTDQGDTAALMLKLDKLGQPVGGGVTLESVAANLRLATGIPDRNKTVDIGGRRYYTDVGYDQVRQGVLSLSAAFADNKRGLLLTVEGGANTDQIRDLFQNQIVHRALGIPEFQAKPLASPFFSLTLIKSF
jgi:hypothetical protein